MFSITGLDLYIWRLIVAITLVRRLISRPIGICSCFVLSISSYIGTKRLIVTNKRHIVTNKRLILSITGKGEAYIEAYIDTNPTNKSPIIE